MMIYINLFLGALIIGFFFVGRKSVKPTKLNLRAKTSHEPLVLEPESVVQNQSPQLPNDTAARISNSTATESRLLSVIFMYNGHDWEAHQVLGVPQGSSMHQITIAYQQLIQKADPSAFPFYEAAYLALSIKHKKHRL